MDTSYAEVQKPEGFQSMVAKIKNTREAHLAADRFIGAGEPALKDLLTDPLVHRVMARDGIDGEQLKSVIANAQTALRRQAA